MKELYVELNGGRSNRRATQAESTRANDIHRNLKFIKGQIATFEQRQKALEKTCDHKVFYDEAGWMYDCRVCAGCGASLGFI